MRHFLTIQVWSEYLDKIFLNLVAVQTTDQRLEYFLHLIRLNWLGGKTVDLGIEFRRLSDCLSIVA